MMKKMEKLIFLTTDFHHTEIIPDIFSPPHCMVSYQATVNLSSHSYRPSTHMTFSYLSRQWLPPFHPCTSLYQATGISSRYSYHHSLWYSFTCLDNGCFHSILALYHTRPKLPHQATVTIIPYNIQQFHSPVSTDDASPLCTSSH